jgi:phosphotriesterase-related protein
MGRVIETVDGSLAEDEARRVLCHEHLWAAFGTPSGDPDLELTCAAEVTGDLAEAQLAGVDAVVDVTTIDMGADVQRTAEIAGRAGVRAVKSTGWFRSPSADAHVLDRDPGSLSDELVGHLREGFAGSGRRAGCLGEVGLTGSRPTPAERRVLDATADAAVATGAGVVLHTDDADNGEALVGELLARGVHADRLLVGHARTHDPVAWQAHVLERGCVLGFDQLGHPQRDRPEDAARRIERLLELVPEGRIAISSDVGRRSRLRAFGGSGYAAGPLAALAALDAAGAGEPRLAAIAGGTAAAFLAREAA